MVGKGLICVRWSTSSTEQTAIAVIWLRVSSEADYEYPIDPNQISSPRWGFVCVIWKEDIFRMFSMGILYACSETFGYCDNLI